MLQDSIKYLLKTLLEYKEFTKLSEKMNSMNFQLKEVHIDYSKITIRFAFWFI